MSRLMLGTTLSMTIALSAALITMAIGTVLGIIAGFAGGAVDGAIGRIIDLTLSFPATLMLLGLSGVLVDRMLDMGIPNGPNGAFVNGLYIVVVLALFGWPPIARLIRGQVLSIREREFVDAAILMGASKRRIYFKEILPNLWAPLLVYFTLLMPAYVSAEAALSYLGVGIKTPTPTLGNILGGALEFAYTDFVFFFTPAASSRRSSSRSTCSVTRRATRWTRSPAAGRAPHKLSHRKEAPFHGETPLRRRKQMGTNRKRLVAAAASMVVAVAVAGCGGDRMMTPTPGPTRTQERTEAAKGGTLYSLEPSVTEHLDPQRDLRRS